jgi:hypothetical protein
MPGNHDDASEGMEAAREDDDLLALTIFLDSGRNDRKEH